jgi:hypothetical protein
MAQEVSVVSLTEGARVRSQAIPLWWTKLHWVSVQVIAFFLSLSIIQISFENEKRHSTKSSKCCSIAGNLK